MKTRILITLSLALGLTLACAWLASAHSPGAPGLPAGGKTEQAAMLSPNTLPYTTFVMAANLEPQTLDPALDYTIQGADVTRSVYDPLLFYEREKVDELVPMLATAWEVSADGLAYTFIIRQGVQFHNGNTLTAEDVAYSLQRGILQGGSGSPQWLFTEAFLGVGIDDITDLIDPALRDNRDALKQVDPNVLLQTCQVVKDAIVADEAGWTVTMNLAQPWGPLLVTLSQPWGSIMDKQWVASNGGWDGSCDTWQDYYAMQADENPFSTIANGTGPFELDHWMPGVEIVLGYNPSYWRTEPMWEGGPAGPAALEQIVIKIVSDEATRYDMLVNGDADMATLSASYYELLDSLLLLRYNQPDGLAGELIHPTGTLKLYAGGPAGSSWDGFFNFYIANDGPRNYIGSGALDGNGIPQDFFDDLHVRKAFNYAFDGASYIEDMYHGEAIRRTGPIPAPLIGYSEDQPTYFYSPTLALEEINQAWGGQVISRGLVMTLTYNTGNLMRQRFNERIRSGVEALSPNFHVNVVELGWSDYQDDSRARQLPVFAGGWLQDIPHPHNWVEPYLVGTYAIRQNLPSDIKDAYSAKIYECVGLSGDAGRGCYEELQEDTHQRAIDIFLAQPRGHNYLRAETRGYYQHIALFGAYYYAISKGPLPEIETIDPSGGQEISFDSGTGTTANLTFPAGAVSEPLEMALTSDVVSYPPSKEYIFSTFSFELQAYKDNQPLPDLTFAQPVTLTVHYTPQAIIPVPEDKLILYRREGAAWVDGACGQVARDPDGDTFQAPICQTGQFTLGYIAWRAYLPTIWR